MPSTPALELEFADSDTEMLVYGEARPADERLVRLLEWWRAARGQMPLPLWSDERLEQIGPMREFVHVHEVLTGSNQVRVKFVGPALVQMIGEDPTGHLFSDEHAPSESLRPTARRTFELVRLAQRTQAPLRACSKSARSLRGGKFMAENLHLPFAGADGADIVLGATIYTPQ